MSVPPIYTFKVTSLLSQSGAASTASTVGSTIGGTLGSIASIGLPIAGPVAQVLMVLLGDPHSAFGYSVAKGALSRTEQYDIDHYKSLDQQLQRAKSPQDIADLRQRELSSYNRAISTRERLKFSPNWQSNRANLDALHKQFSTKLNSWLTPLPTQATRTLPQLEALVYPAGLAGAPVTATLATSSVAGVAAASGAAKALSATVAGAGVAGILANAANAVRTALTGTPQMPSLAGVEGESPFNFLKGLPTWLIISGVFLSVFLYVRATRSP